MKVPQGVEQICLQVVYVQVLHKEQQSPAVERHSCGQDSQPGEQKDRYQQGDRGSEEIVNTFHAFGTIYRSVREGIFRSLLTHTSAPSLMQEGVPVLALEMKRQREWL